MVEFGDKLHLLDKPPSDAGFHYEIEDQKERIALFLQGRLELQERLNKQQIEEYRENISNCLSGANSENTFSPDTKRSATVVEMVPRDAQGDEGLESVQGL